MSSAPPSSWEDYVAALGLQLQRRRVELGLSQEALSHRAGITRNLYQMLEHGKWAKDAPANPSLKVLVRLCLALNIELGQLLPGIDGLRPPQS
jgi:transcriptional regulator with XRE-family HTH domain